MPDAAGAVAGVSRDILNRGAASGRLDDEARAQAHGRDEGRIESRALAPALDGADDRAPVNGPRAKLARGVDAAKDGAREDLGGAQPIGPTPRPDP